MTSTPIYPSSVFHNYSRLPHPAFRQHPLHPYDPHNYGVSYYPPGHVFMHAMPPFSAAVTDSHPAQLPFTASHCHDVNHLQDASHGHDFSHLHDASAHLPGSFLGMSCQHPGCCPTPGATSRIGDVEVGHGFHADLPQVVVPDSGSPAYQVPSAAYALPCPRGSRTGPYPSSSSPRTPRSHIPAKKLSKENARLKTQNRRLCCLLVVLVLTFIATLVPLLWKNPSMAGNLKYFFSASSGSSSSSGASYAGQRSDGDCTFASTDFREVIGKCSSAHAASDVRSCQLDVTAAMCILTETKSDMFNTTRTLEKQVVEIKNELQKSGTALSDISAVYDERHTAHLKLRPISQDAESASQNAKCLQWKTDVPMSPARGMEIVSRSQEGSTCYDIKVTKTGYYFVYSQVTGKGQGQGRTWSHSISKTDPGSGGKSAVLLKVQVSGHQSSLQGVFKMLANHTLSVYADHPQDLDYTKTFFGAFQI